MSNRSLILDVVLQEGRALLELSQLRFNGSINTSLNVRVATKLMVICPIEVVQPDLSMTVKDPATMAAQNPAILD